MINSDCKALYSFLRTQFNDLIEAKRFYYWWQNECDQQLPVFGMFSLRSMAYHISMVLEGYEEQTTEFLTMYIETKYGTEIYFTIEQDLTQPDSDSIIV